MAGRLIIDSALNGCWNMAVDESLLQSASQHQWTLRFYRWESPTLSLGYFQKYADRNSHSESVSCECVRRSTGGGAILHDHEITYSLTCPASDRISQKHEELYFCVHRAIQTALAKQDIRTDLYAESKNQSATESRTLPDPFLCFHRRSNGDIVLQGHKICGSAQRRSKSAILQHGSLLLRKSNLAPQLDGLEDLAEKLIDENRLTQSVVQSLCDQLGQSFEIGDLSEPERSLAKQIAIKKYGLESWTKKK